ncbi:MAG: TIGR00159 family protein [Planctomycetes bacterium]|nr:TIGR00159 family protein [Planctomycetota bacterium]
MKDFLPAAFQVLILAAGIHLFLRFVRATRGNRLIRGLFVSVLVGVVGLWGLALLLKLEELEHLLQASTGYVVVGFAIIFQSELRRGIAQLGEHSFIGGLSRSTSADTLEQVVQAVKNLARQRIGALIVMERETPLAPYIETGTAFDADVQSQLIENLFHPGAALHDGAVILRADRITAAGCILPLTQDADLSPALGTRHRAALGLAEESDAIILIVSEEKGTISLAHGGNLTLAISPDDLKKELASELDVQKVTASQASLGLLSATLGGLRRDIAWLPGSLLLGLGIWYLAHRDIKTTMEFPVVLVDAGEAGQRTPKPGEIVAILPSDEDRLSSPSEESEFMVAVTGTRGRLVKLSGAVRGIVEIPVDWTFGPLEAAQVQWEDPVGGLEYEWATGSSPNIVVERYGTKSFELDSSFFKLDTTQLNPRYQLDLELPEGFDVVPTPVIEIAGPIQKLKELGLDGRFKLQFEPVVITHDARESHRQRIRLTEDRIRDGFLLPADYQGEVILSIVPASQVVGIVTKEIALVCMENQRQAELALWSLPANAQTVRFSIKTYGLIPQGADPSEPAMIERYSQIKGFVEDYLNVYIDIAQLSPTGEGRSAKIQWNWSKDWKDVIDSLKLEGGGLGGREDLDVQLESDREVLLELKPGVDLDAVRPGGENL